MKPKAFRPGDVVQMKSGGPAMTVSTAHYDRDPGEACCLWFEKRGRPHFFFFKVHTLQPAKPDAEEVPAA